MSDKQSNAIKFLESLQRRDLAMLLRHCQIADEEFEEYDGRRYVTTVETVVRAPLPVQEALMRLPHADRKRISEALASLDFSIKAPDDIVVRHSGASLSFGNAFLLSELIIQRELMISVATAGDRIEDVDDYYIARNQRIRDNLPAGLEYLNPHVSLWDWYRYWKQNLSSYADRRFYIRDLFGPLISEMALRSGGTGPLQREPTGWERVDRTLAKARHLLETATAEEDYQAIGLLCREVTISTAQEVYDPFVHVSPDGVTPSTSDAERMLGAFFAHELSGSSNKEVRAHAKAALNLALHLQHARKATKQIASLCVEATSSSAAVVRILANRET